MTTTELPVEAPVVGQPEPVPPPDPVRKGKGKRRLPKGQKPDAKASTAKQEAAPSARPASKPLEPGTVTTLWILVTLGALAFWFVGYALGFSALQQHASQRVLFGELREQLALATAPVGGVIDPGAPVAVMAIPSLGVTDLVVVEGTASSQTEAGPGHRRDTALPGQVGVSVVYGRAITFGAPFRDINSLSPGDEIEVTTGQGEFRFEVAQVRRPGDPLPPPPAADEGRLTLVTSEGAGRLASLTASSTVFVDANLQGKVQPTPAGRPGAVADSEMAMGIDTSGLMALVLWLEALLAVAIGLVWIARRWGGWQTWMVGVPIVLAVVWGATAVAFGLLPNLL